VFVLVCESAEAALAVMLMGERKVDMIFADVRLPGVMDGVELAWEVRQRWPRLSFPIPRIGFFERGSRVLLFCQPQRRARPFR
jgi:CheY-like chemotaxis protein